MWDGTGPSPDTWALLQFCSASLRNKPNGSQLPIDSLLPFLSNGPYCICFLTHPIACIRKSQDLRVFHAKVLELVTMVRIGSWRRVQRWLLAACAPYEFAQRAGLQLLLWHFVVLIKIWSDPSLLEALLNRICLAKAYLPFFHMSEETHVYLLPATVGAWTSKGAKLKKWRPVKIC